MTRQSYALLVAVLLLTVPLTSAQRTQTYEQLTVSSSAVLITKATLTGVGAGQGCSGSHRFLMLAHPRRMVRAHLFQALRAGRQREGC